MVTPYLFPLNTYMHSYTTYNLDATLVF